MATDLFLLYYSRKEIQEEIAYNAMNREVVPKYSEQFGKRPDTINYPNDVYELAKNGATSFHASEELWKNPLNLSTELRKHELDELRTGWDLLIDIDCPYWDYSKLIAQSIVNSLKEHGINSISCKFSGNKGFHIGVPFESFPQIINKAEIRQLFPDAPRVVASYLIYHIDLGARLTKKILSKSIEGVKSKTGKSYEELVIKLCSSCNSEFNVVEKKFEHICPFCNSRELSDKDEIFRKCPKCSKSMEKKEIIRQNKCTNCSSKDFYEKLNLRMIMNIDTILISPRHLYRMPYSLHEKSGFVSLPINPNSILDFDKKSATINIVKISKYRFLDKENIKPNEAALLFEEAMAWKSQIKQREKLRMSLQKPVFDKSRGIETIQEALPEELFPPCIKLILNGLDDGKKRSLFILLNFLSSVGWDYDMIEKKLLEWNEKNKPPIRPTYLLTHIKYHRQNKKKILPPNCDNEMYMKGIGVCKPDAICLRIKNPANYSIRKARMMIGNKENKKEKVIPPK